MSLEAFVNGKKRQNKERNEASIRLDLQLDNPTDEKTNEFSYAQLLQEQKPPDPTKVSLDPLADPLEGEEEEAKLKAIAKKLEEKYGTVHKRTREQDLIDIGEGYDSEDSFVDDSEFYEDYVPLTVDTMYGGFYINTGELEFITKIEEIEDMDIPSKAEPVKPKVKKQASHCTPKAILANKKLKRAKQQIATSAQRSNSIKKKLSSYQTHPKSLLGELNKVPLNVPAVKAPKLSNEESDAPNPTANPSTNAISQTNVVNSLPTSESVPELPSDLPQPILAKVQQLQESIDRDQSTEGKISHKAKNGYDSSLVEIYSDCNNLKMKTKMAVVAFLAYKFGINRSSLTSRIKRIMKKQETSTDGLIQQLKEAIDAVMSSQLAKYEAEMKQYQIDMCNSGESNVFVNNENPGIDESVHKPVNTGTNDKKPPRKSFQWTPEIKSLLNQVVANKVQFETTNKNRNQSGEEIINDFLETQIKPLWPRGWIQKKTLYKLTEQIHSKFTNTQQAQTLKKATVNKEKPSAVIKKEPGALTEGNTTQLSVSGFISPTKSYLPVTPTSKLPLSLVSPSTITSIPNPALTNISSIQPPMSDTNIPASSPLSVVSAIPAQKNLQVKVKPVSKSTVKNPHRTISGSTISKISSSPTKSISVIHAPNPPSNQSQVGAAYLSPTNTVFKSAKKDISHDRAGMKAKSSPTTMESSWLHPKPSTGKVTKNISPTTSILQKLPKEQLETILRSLQVPTNQPVQLILPNSALSLLAAKTPPRSTTYTPAGVHSLTNVSSPQTAAVNTPTSLIHHQPSSSQLSITNNNVPFQFARYSPALTDHCYTSTPSHSTITSSNPLSLHVTQAYSISNTPPVVTSTLTQSNYFAHDKKN